ncbi:bifunctional 2-C-methyl-D-erythritol 4-phosphate cytidylyltransferase/2-C-methyl-D-erythritol 2,4-cyclodiphosphate synthase [Rhodothalassium salexigens]|uniref:bifunctional 2-C-methyl-D-erythritol 4-phosphate cytidylyltransferase/2-C-methyl-D-erythritol 2,4-cyclodiphosphate synthase n=1 Tax=Rhodothalassium salexigens TaxID=1086 RepID=UPI00191400D5|nr:bifunctional 2-C-methyl-D-erythritol 4-phosphate cytidylyltransferase/2-C-methyl-D-erythritol 2,4-cyclodiphosphate synthase [Rhodothalassium salexigens]MBK5911854.1 bifunctional 2-C-methyl-D-erythritol 4-phosphate cytidylyltransferase/2-C-methyl-D-erythritol 2,4-cyclodiphosphate synthase [Rhodothalassium salexigens]
MPEPVARENPEKLPAFLAHRPIAALIVAAGRGRRAGEGLPKQYRRVGAETVLRRSVKAFLAHPAVETVVCVIHPDDRDLYDQAVGDLGLAEPVAGGASRQDSVRHGLDALAGAAPDAAPGAVLIHDAARCFVSADLIGRTLAALTPETGAIPALPVVDTLKAQAPGDVERPVIQRTVPRAGLWRAQTPQAFPYPAILDAHRAAAGQEMTDDAAIFEAAGRPVRLVAGAQENVKLTTPDDFARADAALLTDVRLGTGFDVHAFEPGDHAMLCGVKVPHDAKLKGHSDADVGLHALTDAILGALGDGDIGTHFPPSDPKWRGAASDKFLAHAADLVAARGGRIAHVDVTLICERPKIGPHKDAMKARVAEILGLPVDRVSVKATTSERLGFTGREEGIAAQAAATIRLPERG